MPDWPDWKAEIRARLANLQLAPTRENAIVEELAQHLDEVYEALLAGGATPDEALQQTRAELRGSALLTRELRRIERQPNPEPILLGTNRRSNMIADFLQDLRFGVRMLSKQPGFALVAVLTLALGIGANTTIFSVINGLLLQPIPLPESERLALVWEYLAKDSTDRNIVSAPNFLDWQQQNDVFTAMTLFDSAGKGYDLSGGGSEPQQVSGVRVSWNFFHVLGVQPQLGRAFLPEEETPGKQQVVVLSDGVWRSRYNSDPALIGKTIRVDGADYTVVGVMPPSFQFQFDSPPRQLWVPIAYTEGDRERGAHSFFCLARLKPGVTMEQARAQMNAIGLRLAEQYPKANVGMSATIDPINEFGLEGQRTTLLTLLAVAGFVLLIACINVANLLMARGAVRQRELAIRAALGASRSRTMRQLLTESLLLAFAGGIAGTLLAFWSSSLLLQILPNNLRAIPFRSLDGITMDGKVLAFTWGVTALTGLIFGLAPAFLFSKRNVNEALQEGSRGTTGGGGTRLRQGLVVLEVALALIVLTGAGLMLQSMWRLLNVAPGLDPTNVITMEMSLPQENLYNGPPLHPQFAHELQAQVGSVPGVVSVSAVSHLPIGGGWAGRGFTIEGRPDPGEENQPSGRYSVLCPKYFQTMGIRLRAGREFTVQDTQNAPDVIVINEAMAQRYWPNESALGKRIKLGGFNSTAPWLTVVGIAPDVKQRLDQPARREFFRPYSQAAWPTMTIVVRTASNPATFVTTIKQALLRVEPERAVSGVETMDEVLARSVAPRRFPMLLLLAFSFIALALAAVGIAGVVSFSVAQRTREIGIRMALGASKGAVLRLVLNRSMSAALIGIVLGLLGSFGLTRFLTGMLFEVQPMEPFVLGLVVVLLTGVALLACYLPARRATKVDPLVALRYE
jgi:putative ABC transport system permease protein